MGRFAERLAADLAIERHPWPDIAAAMLCTRGRTGLSRAEFAATVGLPVDVVATLEDGAGRPSGGSAMTSRTAQATTGTDFVEALTRACEWHDGPVSSAEKARHPSASGHSLRPTSERAADDR